MKTNMADNMKALIERDDKLDDMMRKTSEMSDLSYSITKKSRKVHMNAFWSSVWAKILYVIIGLVVLYVIMMIFCGGPALGKCF